MTPYGLQLYSIRDLTEKDLEKGLETAAALGYASVEFAGFFGRPAKEVRATLERLGLRASGTHTGIEALSPDRIAETMEYHLALGCRDLIIPGYPHADTAEGLDELLRTVAYAAPILRGHGIRLGYHNHAFEFLPTSFGRDIFAQLHDKTDVSFEIDTFWAWEAGRDPVALMRRLRAEGRLCAIHLKDGKSGGEGRSIGEGDAPCLAVRSAALELGVPMIVESEGLDPTGPEEVERCIRFLRALD